MKGWTTYFDNGKGRSLDTNPKAKHKITYANKY